MILEVIKKLYFNNREFFVGKSLLILGILNVYFAVNNNYTLLISSIVISSFLVLRIKSPMYLFGHITFYIPMFFVVFAVLNTFVTSWSWGVSMYPAGGLMTDILPYMIASFVIMFILIKILSLNFVNKAAEKIKESYDEEKKERDIK